MNTEEIQIVVFSVFAAVVSAIPVIAAMKTVREERIRMTHIELENVALSRMQEEEKYGHREVTVSPMTDTEIANIDFGPAAYNNIVTGEYNVTFGYTDVATHDQEKETGIDGVECVHCGRINSKKNYYCDGCQAPLYEAQGKADRIALRY